MARIGQYKPNEIIYRDDIGRLNDVFFVLNGKCVIGQCLKMKVNPFQIDLFNFILIPFIFHLKVKIKNGLKHFELINVEAIESASRFIINRIYKAADEIRENNDSHRPLTPNFRKCVPTGKREQPNENVINRMVEVGHYGISTVFGLGELMEDRQIIAKTSVECLLIPRYWLFQQEQNLGNIWQKYYIHLTLN